MSTTVVTPFGREIKRLRAERQMSVRELATAVGKSASYIAKVESRGEVPNGEFICGLAHALQFQATRLLQLAKDSHISNLEQKIDRQHSKALKQHQRPTGLSEPPTDQCEDESRMATVISFINMKGGVGKTTLAMQIAHAADTADLRVLAVDLDPQSNLSQALMSPKPYVNHLRKKKPTVVQILDNYVPPSGDSDAPRKINVKKTIVKRVGYWANSTLDLIPSRLELSRSLKNPHGKERRLAKALAQVQEDYDLIVIDCAPTESVLTDAAYFASRYIVVPVKPEFMATIGLPLLARSLREFQLENEDHDIEIAGIVFNHSSSYSSGPEGQRSIRDVTKIANENGWYLCNNQIKYSASYAKSAREGTPIGQTSYARSNVISGFRRLKDELFQAIGVTP